MILIWVFSGLGCGVSGFEVVVCFCFLIVRIRCVSLVFKGCAFTVWRLMSVCCYLFAIG